MKTTACRRRKRIEAIADFILNACSDAGIFVLSIWRVAAMKLLLRRTLVRFVRYGAGEQIISKGDATIGKGDRTDAENQAVFMPIGSYFYC